MGGNVEHSCAEIDGRQKVGGGLCPFSTRSTAFQGDASAPFDLAIDADRLQQPGAPTLALADAAQLAWRNSIRCIGRLHWKSLKIRDARALDDPGQVFEALLQHLEAATNGGRVTPVMTIFAPWKSPKTEIRVWNHQLIRYAAYPLADGSILGDPMNLALTKIALQLGWQAPRSPGRFDLLPLIIQCGAKLAFYELPRRSVLEVRLRHPSHPWLEKLGLRWYAVPALSDRIFASGQELFPCAPFNGWYMGTEIGARDLADENRYNQLPVIAEKLGLDQVRRGSLWRDHALLVLNEAVISSFMEDGVQLVDHHQASREFIRFCENEQEAGRTVNADWSWIVPPMSGSTTPVFHRQYASQTELPNFLNQQTAWESERGKALLLNHQTR
jgi:nitric-oxide synthase